MERDTLMAQQYTDAMVDIETTHTMPDRGAILQIAAVRFNPITGEVDGDVFDRCLLMAPHRCWSEGTRNFWLEQKESTLREIFNRAEPYQQVMEDFLRWSGEKGKLRFWSKPTHFDYMFIASYFNDCGLPMPFSYRDANDQNSFQRALYFPDSVPADNLEFVGDVHNALYDTFHQIKVLMYHIERTRKSKSQGEITDAIIS
jgi:hypothetical protein